MNKNVYERIGREDSGEFHYLPFIIALVVSLLIHGTLLYFAGDRKITFTGDLMSSIEQKLALLADSSIQVETVEDDPELPIPEREQNQTNPYDVNIEDIFLSVPTATPAGTFEPPVASEDAATRAQPEFQKPGVASVAETVVPWQPREEILMMTDKIIYQDIVPFKRLDVPDIERKTFAPDVTVAYQLTEAIEGAGTVGTPAYVEPAPPKVDQVAMAETLKGGETRMPEPAPVDETVANEEQVSDFFKEVPEEAAPAKPIEDVLKTNLSVYRPRRSDGYVYFRVDIERKGEDVLPPLGRDILFVQDASASLSIDRLHFCRQAFIDLVGALQPTDRLNVMKFNTQTSAAFGMDWRVADAAAKEDAKAFIRGIQPEGNTDLYKAMSAVLALPRDPHRVMLVILATDGRSTAGDVRRDSEIIGQFSAENRGRASIFNLGVSKSSNEFLLSMLSFCNRGGAAVISDDRFGIPDTMKKLLDGIQSPVLSDISFMFDATSRAEVAPAMTTHLYLDRPMQLYGRVKEGVQDVVFQARGTANGKRYDMVFPLDLRTGKVAGKELVKAWATARMYDYVSEHARHPDPMILSEMTDLGREYDITIPFRKRLFE